MHLSSALLLLFALTVSQACGRDIDFAHRADDGVKVQPSTGRAAPVRKPLGESLVSDGEIVSDGMSGASSGGNLSSKKGVGAWYIQTVEGVMEDVGATWFYNWRPSAQDSNIVPPPGIEFVCMIQNGSDVTPEILEIVKEERAKALLTFNEPDRESQAALAVSQALELWPQLESTGKLLGSPVTAIKPLASPWLSEFMYEAQTRNLRVDFLNVHYFNNNLDRWETKVAVDDMKIFLENTYDKYKKPIWVTEWGLTQWLPDINSPTYPEPSVQAAFVKAAAEMMNTLDYVERYAYFPLFPYTKNSKSHMYNNDGSITVVGQAYKSVS